MKQQVIRSRRAWSETENETLDRLYPKYGAEVVARETGRTISSVNEHARRRGLQKPDNSASEPVDITTVWLRRAWTLQETDR